MSNNKKVLVAMSGGVDSSVTAYLLQQAGYEVTGVTMYLGMAELSDGSGQCCGTAGIADARKVCEQLDIPHLVVDYYQQFEERVVQPFINDYQTGRTPNPCVICNRDLKFKLLWDTAHENNCTYLATGHYAIISETDGKWFLRKAIDETKDQSYFLYSIPPVTLPYTLFPLGSLTKPQVREIASQLDLPVATKKDSQDICFIPGGDYRAVLKHRNIPSEPGNIVDIDGKVVGKHEGLPFYTIGQRKGLGALAPVPYYVVDIDVKFNLLVVGEKRFLRSQSFVAGDLNLFVTELPAEADVKIRYQHQAAKARLKTEGQTMRVQFIEPQESITPGQSVVFYAGDKVLGGGVIEEVDCGYRQ